MEESREVLKAEEKCNKEFPNKITGDPTISAPIYFLIREQAKLMVTIKEIHRRLKLLEESQNNVSSAVQTIKFQMNLAECSNHAVSLPTLMHSTDTHSKSVKSDKVELQNSFVAVYSNQLPSSEKLVTEVIHKQDGYNNYEEPVFIKDHTNLRKNEILSQSLCEENDKLIIDCDKQDSGLESDHGQGVNHHLNSGGIFSDDTVNNKKDQDELLVLLDIIKEKGISLRQEVDDLKELTKSDIDPNCVSAGSGVENEMERLHTEKESLQHLIGEVEDEKSTMKSKLLFLETASQELRQENKKLIENLELALSEKQQLEMKIHSLHMQFVKGTSTPKAESWPPLRFANSEKSRKSEKESSNLKISHILNETNALELQRKLLLYLMENEVLYAKLWHAEQSLLTRTSEWKKTEVTLHSRLRHLSAAKDELQIKLGENNLELTAAQAKVEMLEKVLGAVTQDSRDAFDLGYTNRSSFKELCSLPVLREGTNKKLKSLCREIKPFSNQSTFIDISLVHPENNQKLNDTDYEYMAASTIEPNEPRSSTPCPAESEWESYDTNSTLITLGNNTVSDTSINKTTDKGMSIIESDYIPILHQQLSRTDDRTEKHSKSSLSDFSNENTSSMWESISNKDFTPTIQNGFSVSTLNSSLNSSVISMVCQTDNQIQTSNSEKINSVQATPSLSMSQEYNFGKHLKNSADIRQQIQDILDHITGITAADEALV